MQGDCDKTAAFVSPFIRSFSFGAQDDAVDAGLLVPAIEKVIDIQRSNERIVRIAVSYKIYTRVMFTRKLNSDGVGV